MNGCILMNCTLRIVYRQLLFVEKISVFGCMLFSPSSNYRLVEVWNNSLIFDGIDVASDIRGIYTYFKKYKENYVLLLIVIYK